MQSKSSAVFVIEQSEDTDMLLFNVSSIVAGEAVVGIVAVAAVYAYRFEEVVEYWDEESMSGCVTFHGFQTTIPTYQKVVNSNIAVSADVHYKSLVDYV